MNTGNLKLWLGLVSVAGGSVLVVDTTDRSRWIALLSVLLTSLVVLGRYRLCVAAGRFEILNRRCRILLTWLWPCERTGTSFPDVL
ncbi:hypothetical protein DEO72_LG1g2218 [Vigna unguiculata]|uniref:Uncharacterized protein n=1 Tax=Vigna unguiculata TaxID=3917 RepID=A0A4D6KM54_VIGUN|nr:hypothetical protein DEO72_LG1g2218 [Vigna unguiculata]